MVSETYNAIGDLLMARITDATNYVIIICSNECDIGRLWRGKQKTTEIQTNYYWPGQRVAESELRRTKSGE